MIVCNVIKIVRGREKLSYSIICEIGNKIGIHLRSRLTCLRGVMPEIFGEGGVLEVVDTGDLRTRLDWLRLSAGVEAAPPPMPSSPPDGGLVRMEDSSGDRMDSLLSNDVEQLLSAEVDMVSLQLLPDGPCKTPPCVPG